MTKEFIFEISDDFVDIYSTDSGQNGRQIFSVHKPGIKLDPVKLLADIEAVILTHIRDAKVIPKDVFVKDK